MKKISLVEKLKTTNTTKTVPILKSGTVVQASQDNQYQVLVDGVELTPKNATFTKKKGRLVVEHDGEVVVELDYGAEFEVVPAEVNITDGWVSLAPVATEAGVLAVPAMLWGGLGAAGAAGAAVAMSGSGGATDAAVASGSTPDPVPDTPNPAPVIPDLVITGTVAAGLMHTGTIKVYAYDKDGNLFSAPVTVDANGKYNLLVIGKGNYAGTITLVARDDNGYDINYLDEASLAEKDLGSPLAAVTVKTAEATIIIINITPLTTAAALKLDIDIAADAPTTTADATTIANTNIALGKIYKVDDIIGGDGITIITDPSYNDLDGLTLAEAYGKALAALSELDGLSGSIAETLKILADAIIVAGTSTTGVTDAPTAEFAVISALTPAQVAALTSAQLLALNTAGTLKYIADTAVSSINFNGMTPAEAADLLVGLDDAQTSHLVPSQYTAIGADIGVAATEAENLSLLNDVVVGIKSATGLDSLTEINALADAVNAVMTGAAGDTAPTHAQLELLGITGVNADNLPAVQAAITGTNDDGSGVDTVAEVQALVTTANNALAKIANYADANTNPAPTVADYLAAGVTGVDAANLNATNAAIDAVAKLDADTTAEVQTIVEAYNAILAEANGSTADATPADPTAAQYAAIGATLGAAATDAENLSLLNDVIGSKVTTDVDTIAEIDLLAAAVNAVMTGAAAGTAPTLAQLALLGITGVTPDNLPAVLAAIAATDDSGTGIDTLAELQTVVTTAAAAAVSALTTISTAAQGNTATDTTPAADVYAAAGVTGVTGTNLAAINNALDSAFVDGAKADTTAEVQTIVDAYSAILAEANGSTADATPADDPSAGQYAAIGADIGAAATDAENLNLLNDIIGNKNTADVDTVAEINELAVAVNAVMTGAAGNTAPTLAQLQALGITDVTADNLPAVLAAIANTANDGTDVDTQAKLQTVVTTAANAAAAALNTISAAAQANNATGTTPNVATYAAAGVTGVDGTNLAAINSALNSTNVNGAAADTTAEVQTIVEAYNALLTGAD
ncbi:MAG: hypothetical protein JZU50_08645, partial [Desulfobulbaceae bacterium]|nr:hypothetical protein [Desulfobulbaceae bacterium]